ncbi:MAG: leucine--tRNA ligase [Thermoplasmatota archaeon]
MRLAEIESKWQRRWTEARVYEPDAPLTVSASAAGDASGGKFFATYPYSYMNAFAHVGHAFTMGRVDFFVRYQRMLGKRALFPFAYHVTGTPIAAAANRVREGESKQIAILEQQGIAKGEVAAFADPEHWIRFFPKEWRKDVDAYGLGIDWRREFHTTGLNPHYDAFIRWQFGKLRAMGLVEKGRHPVIWCPKDKAPVADHDRYEGEGETPQEWTVYKMRLESPERFGLAAPAFLLAATLRPDTVFGQTNAWIDPEHEYHVVKHGHDSFVVDEATAATMHHQLDGATVVPERVAGRELVGAWVVACGTGARVPVLPAAFIVHGKGTGIVTSVPSDAPQDLLSLRAVQDGTLAAPESAREAARAIVPIPVIATKKYGTESAARAVVEVGARDHKDAARIADATELAYQSGFYEGVMIENAREFAGLPVAEAKDKIRAWLAQRGEAFTFYWPSGPVVCRCLTPAVVKIVSDQWFLKYGDATWKATAREALERLELYPPGARKQFDHVLGWLRDWACARESGLGTRLPWDEKWLIESLSDSTIYMAYYTFAHLVERGTVTGTHARPGVDPHDLTDAFFDHVLLGRGSAASAARGTVTPALVERARREFDYWYPLDFRNSGKDLVQNHLAFMIFNHVAIWRDEPARWPRGIGVNGWVSVDGEKMSKSRGNFILLRDAIRDYGTSATRFAIAYAGEGLDDANFDREFAFGAAGKLAAWLDLATAPALTFREAALPVDRAFRSTMHRLVGEAREAMDATMFRTALKVAFFDLQREWSWYVKRSGGTPARAVYDEFVDVSNRLLTPLIPHVAEEIHAARGYGGFAIDARYPSADAAAISESAEAAERFVKSTLDDVREILKVTGKSPTRVTLFVAPAWKLRLADVAFAIASESKLTQGALLQRAMQDADIKAHGKDAPKLAADLVKSLANLAPAEAARRRAATFDERDALASAAGFLAGEVGARDVRVIVAGDPGVDDVAGKAKSANPGRAAIYIE